MVSTKNGPRRTCPNGLGMGAGRGGPGCHSVLFQLDAACPKEEETRCVIMAPLPSPRIAGPIWAAEDGLPDYQGAPLDPALETSRVWSPGPSEPPTSYLCLLRSPHRMPLAPQAPFSFLPQQGPSSDSHQTCRTDVAQVPPPVGINIITLISPSPLACCASPWLRPAFVSGAIHCIWKCYCN